MRRDDEVCVKSGCQYIEESMVHHSRLICRLRCKTLVNCQKYCKPECPSYNDVPEGCPWAMEQTVSQEAIA